MNQSRGLSCASKGVDFDDFAGFDIVANDSELLVSQTQETIIGHESNETLLAGGSIGEQFVHRLTIDLHFVLEEIKCREDGVVIGIRDLVLTVEGEKKGGSGVKQLQRQWQRNVAVMEEVVENRRR